VAGDALVDLIDYVYRKLTYLVSRPNADLYAKPLVDAKQAMARTDVEMLEDQYFSLAFFWEMLGPICTRSRNLDMEFQICICAINVCRFLTDHRKNLPITLTSRMMETHDVLMTLVPLIEKAPWVRKRKGRFEKFDKHEWTLVFLGPGKGASEIYFDEHRSQKTTTARCPKPVARFGCPSTTW